jgi:hypothetical protein
VVRTSERDNKYDINTSYIYININMTLPEDRIYEELGEMYAKVAVPLVLFSSGVGFWSSVIGECDAAASRRPNAAITSFVNITGCTFMGICSGLFWPVTIPLLSLGAIYNKIRKSW